MKAILRVIAAGLLAGGVFAAQAKLPPPPPKSDAQKATEAEKAKADAAKDAADLDKARDHAVANYKKSHGGASEPAKGKAARK